MLKMLKSIIKPVPIKPLRYAAAANGEKAKQFSSPVFAAQYCRARSKLEGGRTFYFCDRKTQSCYPIAWGRTA